MAKSKTEVPTVTSESVQFTPEEIAAVMAARQKSTSPDSDQSVNVKDLVNALVTAITLTKPIEKKTTINRVRHNPYYPPAGTPRLKLKKLWYQNGNEIDVEQLYNEDIDELNKMKAGRYMAGHLRIVKRKDGGMGIEYPIRTAAQRLKLQNQFHISNFTDLVKRINAERADPTKYRPADEDDD